MYMYIYIYIHIHLSPRYRYMFACWVVWPPLHVSHCSSLNNPQETAPTVFAIPPTAARDVII